MDKEKQAENNTPREYESLFDEHGNMKGKPLSEYNRERLPGCISAEEYIEELWEARNITREDLGIIIR